MTKLSFSILSVLVVTTIIANAQNISGKWMGKLTQGPGDGMSTLYDFELNLNQTNGDRISGMSISQIPDSLDYQISIYGRIGLDSIRLSEDRNMIYRRVVPEGWLLCVKNLALAYWRDGDNEYLQGSWKGNDLTYGERCEPGSVILARSNSSMKQFFTKGGFTSYLPPALPLPVLSPQFMNTNVNKIKEIDVYQPTLQIRISDYKNIDNDTVSVYLNRSPLARNTRISRNPIILNFKLDTRLEYNEILLYAENLGKIPPNTSMMEIIDGDKKYRVMIEADKQRSAAIHLRYKPK